MLRDSQESTVKDYECCERGRILPPLSGLERALPEGLGQTSRCWVTLGTPLSQHHRSRLQSQG